MHLSLKRNLILIPLLLAVGSGIVLIKDINHLKGNHAKADASVALSVQGNHLVNGAGQTVRLYGADLGLENYYCTRKNPEIYPTTINQAYVNAMLAWHLNSVRLVLNEDCWLGINGLPSSVSGAAYQSFIENAVSLFNANGMAVIISLTQALPGTQIPTYSNGTGPLPDSDHSLDFWSSVIGVFKNNPGVIFGTYGEPQDISWSCWLNGCTVNSPVGGTYQGVGMQELVNKMRKYGATQPILVGGTWWDSDLTGWLANKPTDPLNQLAADFHNYTNGHCTTQSCWDSVIPPIAAQVPFIDGEFGEFDCTDNYIDPYMTWADAHNISYLAWTWEPVACTGPSLNIDYNGTPSAFGVGYRAHLQTLYNEGLISDLESSSPPPAPPTVAVTSATNGDSIHGNSLEVDSTDTANGGNTISSVQMLVDNNVVQTITSPPYNFNLDTLNYTDGAHTIEIEATDNQGQVGSQSVSIFVTNGDLNGDGVINLSDLAIMAANWGKTGASYAQGDINGDGAVGLDDLAIMAANWGYINP